LGYVYYFHFYILKFGFNFCKGQKLHKGHNGLFVRGEQLLPFKYDIISIAIQNIFTIPIFAWSVLFFGFIFVSLFSGLDWGAILLGSVWGFVVWRDLFRWAIGCFLFLGD
jgi:hypothetical protein